MDAPTMVAGVEEFLSRVRGQRLAYSVCVTDAQLEPPGPRVLYVNEKFTELTGYTPAEIVGTSPRLLHGPKTDRAVLDRLKRALIERRFFQGQTVNYRRDGGEFLMAWSISAVNDQAGEPVAYIAVQQDGGASQAAEMMTEVRRSHLEVLGRIDSRLETLETLRELLDYADSIVETVRTPLLVLDGECRVKRANGAFYDLFRADPAETVGRSLYELGNRQWDIPRLRGLLDDMLPASNPLDDFEVDHEFDQIGRRVMVLNARQLPLVGKRHLVLLSFEDVTAQRTFEQKLAERANVFIAMLAHELRNPLAPILTASQVLGIADPKSPVSAEARNTIDRQVRQITRLIDGLLEVSRVTRGKIQLKTEVVQLRELVEQSVESVQSLMDEKGHDFTVLMPSRKVFVEVDPSRMQQVISNLLNNAAKYTPERGEVRLTAEAREDEGVLRLTVADNGVGIPEDVLPRVFDLFAQEERSLARSGGGLGIGLTMVKSLVEMHGGSVSVQSPGRGKGSTFTVTLPYRRVTGAPPAAPAATPAAANRPQRPRVVVVVDDNRDAADAMAALLRAWGHAVVTAYDGPAGLEAIRRERPEAVFLDIGLPGLNGFEVAARLRDDGAVPPLLVAVTGYGQEEDRQRTASAGFHGHLTKPVRPDDLAGMLAG